MTPKLIIGSNINSSASSKQAMSEPETIPSNDTMTISTTRQPMIASQSPYQALFDSIPQSGLKCDILFVVIKNRIQEEQEYVRRLRVIFQFNITKDGKPAATWTCDTKTTIEGDIYRSSPKPGLKPDCILTVDDDDWVKIMVGKLNPQRAFMMSKFRIKGNIMLLQKLHAVWFEMRRKGRTPELDLIQEIMVNEQLIPGLKSEAMAIEIVQRIVRLPHLTDQINSSIQVDILKQSRLMTQYLIGMYSGRKPEFRRLFNGSATQQQSKQVTSLQAKADVVLTIEDDDLALLIYGIHKVDDLLRDGRLKFVGNSELVEKAKVLFEQAPIMAKL